MGRVFRNSDLIVNGIAVGDTDFSTFKTSDDLQNWISSYSYPKDVDFDSYCEPPPEVLIGGACKAYQDRHGICAQQANQRLADMFDEQLQQDWTKQFNLIMVEECHKSIFEQMIKYARMLKQLESFIANPTGTEKSRDEIFEIWCEKN